MSGLLEHYKSLPRTELQRELRRITGIQELYLWEYIGLGWMYEAVRAGPLLLRIAWELSRVK